MILEKLNGFVLRILQREEMNRMIRGDCTVSVFFIWKGEKMGRGRKRLLGLQDCLLFALGALLVLEYCVPPPPLLKYFCNDRTKMLVAPVALLMALFLFYENRRIFLFNCKA